MATPKTWKAIERRVAAMFCVERTPLSGGNSKMTRSDTLSPYLFVENKYRETHTAVSLFKKTAELAKKEIAPDGEPKIPVVSLVEKGQSGSYFLVHSDDLAQLVIRTSFFRAYATALAFAVLRRWRSGSNE